MAKNKVFTEAKNDKLFKRYHQLYEIERIRHDDVLKKLSEEFFVSTERARDIIQMCKSAKKNP